MTETTNYPTSWFATEGGLGHLTEYFQRLESWQTAIADGVITPDEIRHQSEHVMILLKEVEPLVTPEEYQQLTDIFYEMAVLQAMQMTAVTTTLLTPSTSEVSP